MENKLRRKFILLSMGSVFFVFLTLGMVISHTVSTTVNLKNDIIIKLLIENEGKFPRVEELISARLSRETPYSTRCFSILMDKNLEFMVVDISNISSISKEDAMNYAIRILDSKKYDGYIDNFQFSIAEKTNGDIFTVFIDRSTEIAILSNFYSASMSICITAFFSIFILIFILSKKAISPIVKNYEKHQRFITDVSHELKTPLTIIKTNNDVVELISGETDWTKSINNQVIKLNELVNNLIILTKMDEKDHKLIKVKFSLSDAISESVEPFKIVVENDSRVLNINIQDNVSYSGDESSIRRVIDILMENAIKYATIKSEITISFRKHGEKRILKVTNFADNLIIGKYNDLFERFYRSDSSRNSKTGGHGIGLSIAKSIIENHRGKIKAESLDGKKITFIVEF